MSQQILNSSDNLPTLRAKQNAMNTELYEADAAGGDVPSTRLINTTSPITGGGSLAADRTIAHANSGVTAGSFTSADITINATGHITAAANGSGGGGGASDAIWEPVRVATTTFITLSGTQTVNGVALDVDDRVLVKDQGAADENGIYVVASGAWSRAADANSSSDFFYNKVVFIGTDGDVDYNRFAFFVPNSIPFVLDTSGAFFFFANPTATETEWGEVRAATQTEVNTAEPGTDLVVTPDTLASYAGANITNKLLISDYQARDSKDSVRVATTASITLSGAQSIDGISVIAGNRVLVKNQATGSQNGIYVCASGAWSRATDTDTSAKVTPQMYVRVEEGSANANRVFYLSNTGTITLGTTALTFAEQTGGVTDHGALTGLADDDHTQYQLRSEKGSNSGYAGLTSSGYVDPTDLGSGTPTSSVFLRGDGSWQTATGSPGADGIDAFSTTSGSFTQPAVNSTVSVNLDTSVTSTPSAWMGVDQYVYMVTGGYYQVDSITDDDTVVLENLGYPGNAAVAATVGTSKKVSPAGIRGAAGSAGHTIQDEGSSLTARTNLNFVGAGVTVTDDSGNDQTDVTIPSTSIDPASKLEVYDDFISGATDLGGVGSLGWQSANGVTVTGVNAEAGHPGIVQKSTGTTSGTSALLRLIAVGTNINSIDFSDTFDATFYLRLNTNDANTQMHIGILTAASISETNGIYFEKVAADTSWFAVCESSNTQSTRVSMGSVSTSWAKFRVRRIDGSTIGFQFNGGTEQTITTQIPTGSAHPGIVINNTAAAAKVFDIDYFHMTITGLSR